MLRFAWSPFPLRRPAATLRGAMVRQLPIISTGVEGPLGSFPIDARFDPGSDDTIFPISVAAQAGIDLTGAVLGESAGVGGVRFSYRCAAVTLRISDGKESCIWQAVVGFIDLPRRFGLLGVAGFIEYFDSTLLGAQAEILLSPTTSYPGQHIIH